MSERKQRGLEGQIRLAGAGAPQENITAWMCLQLYAGRLWTEVKYLSHWGVSGLTLQVLKARSDWFPGQMCLPTSALKNDPCVEAWLNFERNEDSFTHIWNLICILFWSMLLKCAIRRWSHVWVQHLSGLYPVDFHKQSRPGFNQFNIFVQTPMILFLTDSIARQLSHFFYCDLLQSCPPIKRAREH